MLDVLQGLRILSTPFKSYTGMEVLHFLHLIYSPEEAVAINLAEKVELVPGLLSLAHELAAEHLMSKIAAYMAGGST